MCKVIAAVHAITWFSPLKASLCDLGVQRCRGGAPHSRTGDQMWTDKTGWPMNNLLISPLQQWGKTWGGGRSVAKGAPLPHIPPLFDITCLCFVIHSIFFSLIKDLPLLCCVFCFFSSLWNLSFLPPFLPPPSPPLPRFGHGAAFRSIFYYVAALPRWVQSNWGG